jgi:hypothetical protein
MPRRLVALLIVAASLAAPGSVALGATPTATATSCAGAIPWQSATAHFNQVQTVRGPVVGAVYASTSNGKPTFLNIGRDYPDSRRFVVVIWGSNRHLFGAPERKFWGRTICVRGRITSYGGTAQIEAYYPNQVAVG